MAQDRRYTPQLISEVRALIQEEGDSHITGKGIVFNQRSQKLGWFIEIITPDALRDADLTDMKSFFNHDPNYTLGSLANRTLSYTLSAGSLDYDIQAPDNQLIRDLVLAPITRGDITGSSFMFDIAKKGDEWEENTDGVYIRTIRAISKVYEVGPVSMPAYQQTSTDVAKRSFDDFINETKKTEQDAVHFRLLNAERLYRLYA